MWAAFTWLKLTIVNVVIVGICWLTFGDNPGFVLVIVFAVIAEACLIRQLGKEWRLEASLRWWWS
ncbi:hypothetical protein WEH80_06100 [Actinomycetes bacterium KLBMP 9759]